MGKMRLVMRVSWAVALGLLVGGGAMARAQGGSCTFTDEQGKTVTWPNCQPPADAAKGDKPASGAAPAATPPASGVPASKAFPFPGEPAAPSTPAQAPGQTPASGLPPSKAFPFPGETPDAPAAPGDKPAPPNGSGLNDAGSSGSSSSSSSDSSSSSSSGAPFDDPAGGPLADDDDAAAKAAAKRKAERRRLAGAKPQTQDEREAEDLEVAGFYMADSNWRGAYLRATDAVSVDADDPEAHFALAEAARKLGKLDEALTHYKKTLTLDPVPKTKKAAEKAIKEMSGG
jgi:hypothetical protein